MLYRSLELQCSWLTPSCAGTVEGHIGKEITCFFFPFVTFWKIPFSFHIQLSNMDIKIDTSEIISWKRVGMMLLLAVTLQLTYLVTVRAGPIPSTFFTPRSISLCWHYRIPTNRQNNGTGTGTSMGEVLVNITIITTTSEQNGKDLILLLASDTDRSIHSEHSVFSISMLEDSMLMVYCATQGGISHSIVIHNAPSPRQMGLWDSSHPPLCIHRWTLLDSQVMTGMKYLGLCISKFPLIHQHPSQLSTWANKLFYRCLWMQNLDILIQEPNLGTAPDSSKFLLSE